MHKIISYKQGSFLSYQQYEIAYSEHIREEVLPSFEREIYYDDKLVLRIGRERYKGVMRKLLIPCDKAIIEEDAIRLKGGKQ